MPPLLADFTHARPCKPFCEKYLTLPKNVDTTLLTLPILADYLDVNNFTEKQNN